MILGGLDIATKSGFAKAEGDVITASSFRPRAQRPFELAKGAIAYGHEGQVATEFREHLLAWLTGEKIEAVAMEEPLRSNITFKKPVINRSAGFAGQAITYEEKGGTTQGTLYRLYGLHSAACQICASLNIPIYVVNNKAWRSAFLGSIAPPRGCTDTTKWWKDQALRQCQHLRIDVRNADAADAVGIVWWLRGELNPRLAGTANDLFRPKPTIV